MFAFEIVILQSQRIVLDAKTVHLKVGLRARNVGDLHVLTAFKTTVSIWIKTGGNLMKMFAFAAAALLSSVFCLCRRQAGNPCGLRFATDALALLPKPPSEVMASPDFLTMLPALRAEGERVLRVYDVQDTALKGHAAQMIAVKPSLTATRIREGLVGTASSGD